MLLLISGCGDGTGTDIRTTAGPKQFAGISAHFSMGTIYLLTPEGALGTTPATQMDLDIFESTASCPDPAADAGAGILTLPSRVLSLSVSTVQPRPLTAGIYDLPANDATFQTGAWLQERHGSMVDSVLATQGRIELARMDPEAEGTVDLTLVDGTHLSGTFRATRCHRVCFGPSGPDGGYVTQSCDP